MSRLFSDRLSPALQSNLLDFSAVKSLCPPSLQDCSSQFMWSSKKGKKKKSGITRVLLWSAAAALWANQVMMHVIRDGWCCAEGGRQRAEWGGGDKRHLLFFKCQPEQGKKNKLNIPVEKKQWFIAVRVPSVANSHACTGEEDIYVCTVHTEGVLHLTVPLSLNPYITMT